MRAVLSLDHAAELMLRAILPEVGQAPKPNDHLGELIKRLSDAKPRLSAHGAALHRVRHVRNGVQHEGTIASEIEARLAAREVETFLRAVVQEVLGKTLEEITLVELVMDARAKSLLRDAERQIIENQYADACIGIATAFYWATGEMFEALIGEREARDLSIHLFNHIHHAVEAAALRMRESNFGEFADALRHAFHAEEFSARGIFEPLLMLTLFSALGISPRDAREFVRRMPAVDFSMDGTAHVTIRRDWPPSRETSISALQFAVNAILKMQVWATDGDREDRH